MTNDEFIIPEYKIDLLNKSKKIISTIENINPIVKIKKIKASLVKDKKIKNKETAKSKGKVKKIKPKKQIRTLWVRRKKTRSSP